MRSVFMLFIVLASHAAASTVALLPLDNVNGEEGAAELRPLITKAIEAKGWTVAGGEVIEALLESERVRYLDALERNVRQSIVDKTNAEAILLVTVYSYAQTRNPTVALSARLIDRDGVTTWADVAGLTAGDTERALGLGKKETVGEVAAETLKELLREFPKAGTPAMIQSKPHARRFGRPASFSSADFDPLQRICVLPFDNDSNVPNAPRVLADVLALRLASAGFNVVDPAILRAAALEAGISFRATSSQELAALAKIVGTPLFLRGTVYAFSDPTMRGGGTTPILDLEATLVDVHAGKVLWAVQDNRKGTDSIGFLMLGAVSNSVSLTDRVATEMIATARTNHENANHPGDRAAVAAASRKGGRQPHAGQSKR